MRALTIYPHYAHAICWHNKRIENRSRAIPKALVERRIAIHAGVFRPGPWWDEVRAAGGGAVPRGCAPVPLTQDDVMLQGPWDQSAAHMQCRAIVATAVIRPWSDSDSARWGDREATWWWALDDVRVLPHAVPRRRGQLGLWRLPASTERSVREQL